MAETRPISSVRTQVPAPAPAAARSAAPSRAAPVAGSRLWDLLTPEEQAFFARQAPIGPLTYSVGPGRSPGPTPAAPRSGRLDVRG